MKKNRILSAGLLALGMFAISCAKIAETDHQAPREGEEVLFTTTIGPKEEITKAVDANGVTTWVVGEQLAMRYLDDWSYEKTAVATVTAVSDKGIATISANLSFPKDNETVYFVYPASIANSTYNNVDFSKLANQHGTLADISAQFDAATGNATMRRIGDNWTTAWKVTMTNRVAIGKFTPMYGDSPISNISTLIVRVGTKTYTITPESGTFGTEGIYVALQPVSGQPVTISAISNIFNYVIAKDGISFGSGKLYNNLVLPMGLGLELSTLTSDYTVWDKTTITGTLNANVKISIANDATVTLHNVTINGVNDSDYMWAGLTCLGNATINLSGTNLVRGFHENYPGIQAPYNQGLEEYTLTIQGPGALTAISNGKGAGIGGGYYDIECDNIVINGGDIRAIGGTGAAGIGSAYMSTCRDITISDKVTYVVSQRGSDAPHSIGKGQSGSCGNVIIGGHKYWDGSSFMHLLDDYYLPVGKFVYPVPDNCVPGLFTVSDTGKEVFFSDGNIQFLGGTSWKFADNQYEFLGNTQGKDHRDLFGWGTGDQPNETGNAPEQYTFYSEWGEHMGTGWRTPTQSEFQYLFSSTSKYGFATVANKKGIILLPDGFNDPMKNNGSGAFKDGTNTGFSQNIYSSPDWIYMEACGCVFLPAAGFRVGDSSYTADYGGYWTSTRVDASAAAFLAFDATSLSANDGMVSYRGNSVRVVRDK